jgi:hypothetical protein
MLLLMLRWRVSDHFCSFNDLGGLFAFWGWDSGVGMAFVDWGCQ